MYEAFYHLPSNPFRLTPDPNVCFSHSGYRRAREYLEYALKLGEGVVMVTGRAGTGKTTLIDSFMSLLDMSVIKSARIAASNLDPDDLLRAIAYAYGIDAAGLDKATLRYRIQHYFEDQVQAGWRVLLIIDEAQSLPRSALEELRLLADLQVESRQLLQLFIVGQEQLREQMADIAMDPFQQRVIANYHLVPLSLTESRSYVEYRLRQAGWLGDPEFTGAAIRDIYRFSRGIPRHINKLCNRLLLLGYGKGRHTLDSEDVRSITTEMSAEQLRPIVGAPDINTVTPDEAMDEADSLPLSELAVRLDEQPVADVVNLAKRRAKAVSAHHSSDATATAADYLLSVQLIPVPQWRTRLAYLMARWRAPVLATATFASVVMTSIVLIDRISPNSNGSGPAFSSQPTVDTLINYDHEMDSVAAVMATPSVYEQLRLSVFTQRDGVAVAVKRQLLQQILNDELPLPAAGQLMAGKQLASVSGDRFGPSWSIVALLHEAANDVSQKKTAPRRRTALDEMLSQGQQALQGYRLLTPARDSAYFYFQRALKLQPGNAQAIAGMAHIVERYVQLAEAALEQQENLKAHRYIIRGLSLEPDNAALQALQARSQVPVMTVVLQEDDISAAGAMGQGIGRFFAGIRAFFTASRPAAQTQNAASYQMTSSFVHE